MDLSAEEEESPTVVFVDYSVTVADADKSAAVVAVLADDGAVAATLAEAGLTDLLELSTVSTREEAAAVDVTVPTPSPPGPALEDGGEEQENEPSSGGAAVSLGAIVGIVIGAALVVGSAGYLYVKHYKKADKPTASDERHASDNDKPPPAHPEEVLVEMVETP